MCKKLYILSLGCPKNLVDSEVMLGLLGREGYSVCQTPEEADLLLVNTCGFIQSAVEEGIDEIISLAKTKEEHPEKQLVVTGCMVQRYGADLRKELPEVDLFIGTDGFQDIAEELKRLHPDQQLSPLKLHTPSYIMDSCTPRRQSTPPHRAYLKITEGCANRCSYCLIPSLRGKLRSRPPADLIQEVKGLEKAGVKELTLIAQDLTSYGRDLGRDASRLNGLLEEILNNCDIPWIRLLYLHPARLKKDLLTLMANNPRIAPYLDIPLQHVNSRILQLMNRPYGKSDIERLLERIRNDLPGAAIRTTFMVGFPGETENDFAELEEFLKSHLFEHVGVFTYSNEEGCAAATLPAHCDKEGMESRRQRLMEIQAKISLKKNRERIGKKEEVLVEGISRESDLLLEGRTRYQAPDIDGSVYITSGVCNPGDIVTVHFTEAHPYDLIGEIVDA